MKTNIKKFFLNIALSMNILIFIILSVVAFWSVGFANGDVLGAGIANTKTAYFWLGLLGFIFIILAIIMPVVKAFNQKPVIKKLFDLINLVLLITGTCLMLASHISFIVDLDSDKNYFKIIGAVALIVIGFIVSVQPQLQVLVWRNLKQKPLPTNPQVQPTDVQTQKNLQTYEVIEPVVVSQDAVN